MTRHSFSRKKGEEPSGARAFVLLVLLVLLGAVPVLAQDCTSGQNESIFAVAASGDDGTARRYDYGPTYPPAASNNQDSSSASLVFERSLDGYNPLYYATTVALLRWNTAAQPDGGAWPVGTVVTGGLLRARYSATGSSTVDGDVMVLEWYAWTPPISDGYWTNNVPTPGDATYAGADAVANYNGYHSTMLTNVNQINLSGYTGIRAGISGGQPTGFNGAQWYTWDYSSGAIPEQLVVCWTITNTPTPTVTGTPPTPTPTVTGTPPTPTPTPTNTRTPRPVNTPTITNTPPPPTPTPTPSTALEDGRYLPPNTWVRLNTVPTERFIPYAYTDCTQVGVLSHPVGRRASSIVYGGGIFYFGGGGGSNPGNDVELFDIALNTWTQQYQPECIPSCCAAGRCADGVAAGRFCSSDADCPGSRCGEGQCYTGLNAGQVCLYDSACAGGSCLTTTCSGGPDAGGVCYYQEDCAGGSCSVCDAACSVTAGGTSELTPMGRPYVEHAYQLVTYNPLRKKYTYAHTSGTWEWDPSTTEWARLTPDRPESSDIATKMLVYNPDLETVLYFATTSTNHTVFRFDYATDSWVAQGPIPNEISWADIFAAYDSKEHKYLVSHGSGTMWIYDALAGTWTQLQNVPADVTFSYSLAYDPIADVILLGKPDNTGSVQLWSYRVATDTWARQDVASAPPMGPTSDSNLLVYDQIWKRFYFLNARSEGGGGQGGSGEGDVETWAYRIGGPVGPGDANCDGRLAAADLSGLIQSRGSNPTEGCGAVDTNRDGVVNDVDVSNTVATLFEIR